MCVSVHNSVMPPTPTPYLLAKTLGKAPFLQASAGLPRRGAEDLPHLYQPVLPHPEQGVRECPRSCARDPTTSLWAEACNYHVDTFDALTPTISVFVTPALASLRCAMFFQMQKLRMSCGDDICHRVPLVTCLVAVSPGRGAGHVPAGPS